jgi:hypothetical protein
MRTTLSLDADIPQAARSLARAKTISIGAAVSDMARRGLEQERPLSSGSMPHFPVPPGARVITLEDVKWIEDEW